MARPVKRIRYLEHLLGIVAGLILINLCTGAGWPWMRVVGAPLGIGMVVLYFLRFVKTLRRDVSSFVVLKSETGSVRVHAAAVEEALRRTAKSLPEVHDVRVRLVLDPQTSVPQAGEVDARIRDITNIVSVHAALSKVLAERYEQIIPGAPPIEFHLTIKHHFRPPSKPKKREKKILPPEEDETQAVRAPQYPVPE